MKYFKMQFYSKKFLDLKLESACGRNSPGISISEAPLQLWKWITEYSEDIYIIVMTIINELFFYLFICF